MGFLIRLLIAAAGLWAASLVPGISIASTSTLLIAALLLGVVNAVVRPVLVVLTLPITVITLGLFLLVINAAMLGLVAWLLEDFSIQGFGPALLGSVVVSVVSWIGSRITSPAG
jgi:putative membrane protein